MVLCVSVPMVMCERANDAVSMPMVLCVTNTTWECGKGVAVLLIFSTYKWLILYKCLTTLPTDQER